MSDTTCLRSVKTHFLVAGGAVDPERLWNIIPEGDLLPHREGTDCECQPTVRFISSGAGGHLIIHAAWDCREYFES